MRKAIFILSLIIILAGCVSMTLPSSRLIQGDTFCNNNICETTMINRMAENPKTGEYIEQVTIYQINCDKGIYKIVNAYDHRYLTTFGEDTRQRFFNNAEMLIQPNTYISSISNQYCNK